MGILTYTTNFDNNLKGRLKLNIQGLQKLTLLDFPGTVACTIFTGGCNFRCPFCHNASFITDDDRGELITQIETSEVIVFLKKRQRILDGICISGGEPLMQPDLGDFIYEVKNLGYRVKVDTNGSFSEKLKGLMRSGLVDYVAMDIKNAPENYAGTIGCKSYDLTNIRDSAAFLMEYGIEYEFRTTVVRELHTLEDFDAIGRWLKGAKRYFLQAFVDSGDILEQNLHGYTKKEMETAASVLREFIPSVELRGI